MRLSGTRADLAGQLREQLAGGGRVVETPRSVDVQGPTVQVYLDNATWGQGEAALHRTVTLGVFVVQPGDAPDDALEALLDDVLEVVEAADDYTWTDARRAVYPPQGGSLAAFLITVEREV